MILIIRCSSIRHCALFKWSKALLLFLLVSSSVSSSSRHIHPAVVQWAHRLSLTLDRGRLCLLGELQGEGWSPAETESYRLLQITHPHTFQKCQEWDTRTLRLKLFPQQKSSQVYEVQKLSQRTSLRRLTPSVRAQLQIQKKKNFTHKSCTVYPKIWCWPIHLCSVNFLDKCNEV